jgi:hypothetical protein
VLLKRNNRRGRCSGIKKKLLGQQQQQQHDHKTYPGSSGSILEKTKRDSIGGLSSCEAIPSHSHRGSGNSSYNNSNVDDHDCLGISIKSSVAPPHNLKHEEVMLSSIANWN